MVLLVTGGTGLIGYTIAKMLKEEDVDANVRTLVRTPTMEEAIDLSKRGIDIIKGDLTRKETLVEALKDVDTVYHVAALVREIYPNRFFYEVNHQGTNNLLDAFEKRGGERFIYTSTSGVYGFNKGTTPIKEEDTLNLMPGYRESKWLGEREVLKRAKEKGFFATSIRPCFVFGPNDKQFGSKVFNLVTSSSSGKKIPIINGGNAIMSLCYVDDMARAHIECASTPKANGEVFNCAGFHSSVRELIDAIAEEANVSPKYKSINYYVASTIGLFSEMFGKIFNKNILLTRTRVKQFGRSKVLDTRKIERIVGFKPEYDLRRAVEYTYQWLKKTGAESVI